MLARLRDRPDPSVHDMPRTAAAIVEAPANTEAGLGLTLAANPPAAPGCQPTAERDAIYLRRLRWMY
jgi:hypothetical protein